MSSVPVLLRVVLPHKSVVHIHTALTCYSFAVVQALTLAILQVYTDDDISTKFHWQRPHMLSSESTATVTWKIPEGTEDGTYMIWNYGDYKHLTGGTVPFTGHSSESSVSFIAPKLRKYILVFCSTYVFSFTPLIQTK